MCSTYRTPRTFFPLWWTNSCIAIFFMLCWFIFSSTMFILNSNRLFDIAMNPDTVDFSSFQATAASSRTWSPRLHTPPTDWLLMMKSHESKWKKAYSSGQGLVRHVCEISSGISSGSQRPFETTSSSAILIQTVRLVWIPKIFLKNHSQKSNFQKIVLDVFF